MPRVICKGPTSNRNIRMCELLGISSRLPTRATVSLERFARRGGYPASAVDGWGIALCEEHDVRLYKEPEPAADSLWVRFIEERRQSTRLLISHIRHATRGRICLSNTQPFIRELGGRTHIFAHNGQLEGIKLPHGGASGRFLPLGETDSEIAFCILLEQLFPLWRDGTIPPLIERHEIVAHFAADMRSLGPANFLYWDGELLFAHGHRRIQAGGQISPPGLWLLKRTCPRDRDALLRAGASAANELGPQKLTLIASVPLTDEDWTSLGDGELVVVRDGEVLPTPHSEVISNQDEK